ncbi:histidine phosphatase family protein [Gordonia neofelifaecis]|uniref:Phosphoglycerate mutase family protein n=1 Tax=Gordonia neofelifaecis NRRL B-59395 TaxID=644548 RepID=F1YGA6_9ACTN|nr:histidine phosphatase family protein [Gordonia neofelifaecis]EGD56125.1 phosphoglycerate mutase family protein [Gordonia neofelifaecis NRRL B-59395]
MSGRLAVLAAAAVAVAGLTSAGFGGAAQAAPTAPELTITLVRHAESEGNASGLIDTKTPGPDLTELGRTQAQQNAILLAGNRYDGVFASRMVRTQQTARPLAQKLFRPVVVEPGFHEILAGDYEGQPEATAQMNYFQAPTQWMRGNLDARIPGAEDGHEFKKRFNDSLAAVVRTGVQNPVIFSHGGTIMTWSIMTATNAAEYAGKLAAGEHLRNVGRVVLKGNPTTGWRIVEWVAKPALPELPAGPDCGLGSVGTGSLAAC